MKIFQNKIPKSWKSSGVSLKNSQMEMSNFSFAEDYFKSTSNKFLITIIGKNIIGDGLFSITIYKESFVVWQEQFSFKNISFSKKTIEIEEEQDKDFRIVISRGRSAKGKILINSITVNYIEKEVSIQPEVKEPESLLEDEPTFIVPVSKKSVEAESPKVIDEQPIVKKKTSTKKVIEKKKKSEPKNKTEKPKTEESKKKPRATKKLKELAPSLNHSNQAESIVPVNDISPSEDLVEPLVEEKKRNSLWVHIMDFSTINDEREVFKFINQISFGKGKQIFLIKENKELSLDLSRYEHVTLLFGDDEFEIKLLDLYPNKITFLESNLGENLLKIVKKAASDI